MKSRVLRTAVIASAITTVLVTALTLFALPKVPAPTPVDPVIAKQPAITAADTDSDERPSAGRIVLPTDVRDNSVEATTDDAWPSTASGQHRSTAKSAAIIAGSAGTGAAIGAIAKGGKGAAIGAIAGGVAGLIYDRLTADGPRSPAPRRVARRK